MSLDLWLGPAITRRTRPASSRRVNILAAIPETPVLEKILTHLGVVSQPPPKGPARRPESHFAA